MSHESKCFWIHLCGLVLSLVDPSSLTLGEKGWAWALLNNGGGYMHRPYFPLLLWTELGFTSFLCGLYSWWSKQEGLIALTAEDSSRRNSRRLLLVGHTLMRCSLWGCHRNTPLPCPSITVVGGGMRAGTQSSFSTLSGIFPDARIWVATNYISQTAFQLKGLMIFLSEILKVEGR
jgi:hypothetical protein